MYRKFLKRIFDLIVVSALLILSLPVMVLLTMLLIFNNKGKAFFFQERPGLHGKPFHIIKFKTMNDRKDKAGMLLPDKDRLTRLGRFIRKTSLDEIPQLWNVIKGDLSLIGPRPLLMEYLPLYTPEQARRHEVRPGITGWAQVNGRNRLSWEDKFRMDLFYVDHLSFLLDMKIILHTIEKLVRPEGISSATSATMEKFQGTKAAL